MSRLWISLAYLAREKRHQLRHPDRTTLFGFTFLLLLGLSLETLFILSLRRGFVEVAELALAQGLDPRDVLVSLYFVFLAGLTWTIILFGFARAQTVNLERIRFLPLRAGEIYLLELASKFLVALGAVVFLLPLTVATIPWLGGGAGRSVLFVAVSLTMAIALAELAVLLLLVIEGTTQAGRLAFRIIFAVFVLGAYSLRFLLPREKALAAAAADWTPWGVARRVVLEADAGAIASLVLALGGLYLLGMLAYRVIYLGDFRVSPTLSRFDGAAPFRLLGFPLAIAGRESHTIFRLDCTQVFRNPLAFTIFLSPAVILLVLNSSTGLLENPSWRFRIPLLISYLLTSLLGLNPIGRDGGGYPLLRLMPVRRRSELTAKIGLGLTVSTTFGGATCVYYYWGEWGALLVRLVTLFLFCLALAVLAAYLGIRRPVYGRLTGGPLVRFPFLGLGLLPAVAAEAVHSLAWGLPSPIILSVFSLLMILTLYPRALARLENWRVEYFHPE